MIAHREDHRTIVFTDDHQKAIESLEEVEEPVLIGKSSDSRTYPARAEFRNLLAVLENQDGFSSIAPLLVQNREAIESILFPAPPKKPSPVPKEIKRDKVSDLNKSTAYLYARDWIQSRRGEFKSSTEWAKELEKAGYLTRTGNRMSWKTFTVPIPELARNGEIVKRADGLYGCP